MAKKAKGNDGVGKYKVLGIRENEGLAILQKDKEWQFLLKADKHAGNFLILRV